MKRSRLTPRNIRGNPALSDTALRLRALLMSGNGVLSVDGLDALVRGLAMATVVLLSLLGYDHPTTAPGAGRILEPMIVAIGLVAYNFLVIALLGVPWRHRPGFNLFLLDWAVASSAIALTGWIFSPFIILLYALVIGAALRLGFSRSMSVVCGCALFFLTVGATVPVSADPLKLPILVVEATSLVMVAVTAAALRRAVEVEIRHVEREEQSAQQFRLLNELINSLLSGTPDLDSVTRSVAQVSKAALEADAGLVVMSDREGGRGANSSLQTMQLSLAADRYPNPVVLTHTERELVARVITSGASEVLNNLHDLGGDSFPTLARGGRGVRLLLCVPFAFEGACVGAILVGRHESRPFSEADINLLTAIGQQMSVAVRLARLYAMEHEKTLASEERERLERDLLSIVSHDLRTPLTAIKLCAGALSHGSDAETHGRMVRNIERNADRLAGLVDDLIDMARLRSGRLTLDFRMLNMGEVLDELSSQVWPVLESKAQSLHVDLPANGSLRWHHLNIQADRRRIEQVLLNLIANAHKYAPPGGTITVGATPRDGEVRVFVRDEGPGIALHEQARIFEKFYTTHDEPGNTASQSVGLGLAIARSLVSLHGGEIGVQSRVGGGSTFFFTLPNERARNDVSSQPTETQEVSDAYPGH